jgi:hypothetical protein
LYATKNTVTDGNASCGPDVAQHFKMIGVWWLYVGGGGAVMAIVNGVASSILTGSLSLSPVVRTAAVVGGSIGLFSSTVDVVAHLVKPDYDSNRILNIARHAFLWLIIFLGLGNISGNAFSLTQKLVLSLLPVSLDYLAMEYYFHKRPPVLGPLN